MGISRSKTLRLFSSLGLLLFLSCSDAKEKEANSPNIPSKSRQILQTSLIILGTVQDGGSPHIGCKKECCKTLFLEPDPTRKVVSLGLIDPEAKKTFLFEATPDISEQLKLLTQAAAVNTGEIPDGIFLTHAHIGHYTGLMYLGKEATNADSISVYAMPRMKGFLEQNGPWDQLVNNKNILINEIKSQAPILLGPNLTITPFIVPHRDEYSETAGYKIKGPTKTALFIPDIDKWEKWEISIIDEIAAVDLAFIDASFFDAEEINNRDISQIPHPFVIESMKLFQELDTIEKSKIHFIHFNHTNPLLNDQSDQTKEVLDKGYQIAKFGQMFAL